MANNFSNDLLDSEVTVNGCPAGCNVEFIGTLEQEGRVCDYYLVLNESKTYYYYVLRPGMQNNC